MLKIFNYFFQSIFIYLFFFIGLILGLRISRKLFSSLFSLIGPFIKSQKVINENLNIFLNNGINLEREKTINEMWKNYGMTFIEYIFLNRFRKKSSHITIKGKEKLLNFLNSIFAKFPELRVFVVVKNFKFGFLIFNSSIIGRILLNSPILAA